MAHYLSLNIHESLDNLTHFYKHQILAIASLRTENPRLPAINVKDNPDLGMVQSVMVNTLRWIQFKGPPWTSAKL